MTIMTCLWLITCTGACGWLGWQVFQLKQNLKQQTHTNQQMLRDLNGLILCMRGVSERFEKQQRQLRSVTVRQNDIAEKSVSDSHYKQASFMMEKGATVDELVRNCGLSRGEAELMARINSMQSEQLPAVKQAGLR